MTVLEMDPAKFPARAKALYDRIAARRRAKGEGFGGPYLALLNHPALAERVEALGFYLKFEGVLPRGSVLRARPAPLSNGKTM
jgi:4-carboxymuconolactone decarboxylase